MVSGPAPTRARSWLTRARMRSAAPGMAAAWARAPPRTTKQAAAAHAARANRTAFISLPLLFLSGWRSFRWRFQQGNGPAVAAAEDRLIGFELDRRITGLVPGLALRRPGRR